LHGHGSGNRPQVGDNRNPLSGHLQLVKLDRYRCARTVRVCDRFHNSPLEERAFLDFRAIQQRNILSNFAAENLPWLALRKRKGSLERNRQYRSGRDLAAVAVLATLFSLCEEP
jgi:hypothetical protein